jgi:hypothetical protein
MFGRLLARIYVFRLAILTAVSRNFTSTARNKGSGRLEIGHGRSIPFSFHLIIYVLPPVRRPFQGQVLSPCGSSGEWVTLLLVALTRLLSRTRQCVWDCGGRSAVKVTKICRALHITVLLVKSGPRTINIFIHMHDFTFGIVKQNICLILWGLEIIYVMSIVSQNWCQD